MVTDVMIGVEALGAGALKYECGNVRSDPEAMRAALGNPGATGVRGIGHERKFCDGIRIWGGEMVGCARLDDGARGAGICGGTSAFQRRSG